MATLTTSHVLDVTNYDLLTDCTLCLHTHIHGTRSLDTVHCDSLTVTEIKSRRIYTSQLQV